MDNRQIVEAYYRHANSGDWDAWCDLLTADCVMDEQLAGRIVGRETLRDMMKGFPEQYARFVNEPAEVIVEDDRAVAISRISALAASYPDEPIEARVANYYEFAGEQIAYMANYHDSKPFTPFLRQIGALD